MREGRDRPGSTPAGVPRRPGARGDEVRHRRVGPGRPAPFGPAPHVARCPCRPSRPPVCGFGTVAGVRGIHPDGDVPADAARTADERGNLPPDVERHYPEVSFQTQTIGRTPKGALCTPWRLTVGPLDPNPGTRRDVAQTHLTVLVDLFRRGMQVGCCPLFARRPPPTPPIVLSGVSRAKPLSQLGRNGSFEGTTGTTRTGTRSSGSTETRFSFVDMIALTGGPVPGEGIELDPPEPLPVGAPCPYALGRASCFRELRSSGDTPVPAGGGRGGPVLRRSRPVAARPTLLEASAGTGKTFTTAALTARYVAEECLLIERLSSPRSLEWPPESCASECATVWCAPSKAWSMSSPEKSPPRMMTSCSSSPQCRASSRRTVLPAGQRYAIARFRRGHDRDDTRVLPAGALRPRHRRRCGPRRDACRGLRDMVLTRSSTICISGSLPIERTRPCLPRMQAR